MKHRLSQSGKLTEQPPISTTSLAFGFVLTFTFIILSILVVSYFRMNDKNLANLQFDAHGGKNEFDRRVTTDIEFISLFVADHAQKPLEESAFVTTSNLFIKDHPELLGIFKMDAHMHTEWITPTGGNIAYFNYTNSLKEPAAAAQKARETGKITYSDPYVSVNGQLAIAAFAPLVYQGAFDGMIEELFSLTGLMQYCVPGWVDNRYELHILDKNNELLAHEEQGEPVDLDTSATIALASLGGQLKLKIDAYGDSTNWALKQLIYFAFLSLGGMLLSIYFLRISFKRMTLAHAQVLKAKEAAEEANAAKSAFVSGLSHEIRTPLGAMLGYIDLLSEPSTTPLERDNFASAIKRNGEILLRLVNDILDLSKIEAGLFELEIAAFSLGGLLRDLQETVEPAARKKQLAVNIHFATAVPVMIQSDQLRLRQILLNLLHNAIKFSNSGSIECIVSWFAEAEQNLQFKIIDHGIGIDLVAQGKLFQSFVQADAKISRSYGGTGLGLALSRKMAHLLQGDLHLESSQAGDGSTFCLTISADRIDPMGTIPAGPMPLPEVQRRSARCHQASLQGLSILVIDDSLDNQFIIKRYLRLEGASVHCTGSGEEGLQEVQHHTFDMVLLDMELPGISGYETARRLRDQSFKNPIIALTAHSMKGAKEECLKSGCDDYLAKPVSQCSLLATVTQYLAESVRRAS